MMDFVIYTTALGNVSATTISCVNKLYEKYDFEGGYNFHWEITFGDTIGRARSVACYDFLTRRNEPYMMFLDGDIYFTEENMDNLLSALKEGYGVVGGLYAVSGAGFLSSHNIGRPLRIAGEIEEIDYLATGFVGISRKVLEKMRDKLKLPLLHEYTDFECYPFFESGADIKKKSYLSEDYDFCNKVRASGQKVYVHTMIQLGHEKKQIFWAQQAIRNTESLIPTVFEDAREYLGRDITQELFYVTEKAGRDFVEWQGTTEDFYKHNEDYIIDNINTAASPGYMKLRYAPVKDLKGEKIVDIGCGLGAIAMKLAKNGNEVVGYDINEATIGFANFIKKKYKVKNITFTTKKPDYSKFNYILAVSTLEHIEDLRSFLIDIGKETKLGTRFYHSNDFEHKIPQHFDHSKKFNDYLKEAGFMPWNQWFSIKIRDG